MENLQNEMIMIISRHHTSVLYVPTVLKNYHQNLNNGSLRTSRGAAPAYFRMKNEFLICFICSIIFTNDQDKIGQGRIRHILTFDLISSLRAL